MRHEGTQDTAIEAQRNVRHKAGKTKEHVGEGTRVAQEHLRHGGK